MRNTSRDYQFTAHFTVITANKQVPEGDKIAKKKGLLQYHTCKITLPSSKTGSCLFLPLVLNKTVKMARPLAVVIYTCSKFVFGMHVSDFVARVSRLRHSCFGASSHLFHGFIARFS